MLSLGRNQSHGRLFEQVEWETPEVLSAGLAGDRPSKRLRPGDDALSDFDVALDQSTAWALGFTPDAVTAEEEDLLPPGSNEDVYVTVSPLPSHPSPLPPSLTCTP